ncbi:MAG: DNA-processing protein DprA [Bacteroidales bacterium]|nr:DNA-processing protein DprA [Bacteroidales bacterium]
MEELFYTIVISLTPNIGPVNGKRLITYYGSAKAVFEECGKSNGRAQIVKTSIGESLHDKNIIKTAEQELDYISGHGLKAISFLDKDYPERLKRCNDGPLIIFSRGNKIPNMEKVLAIVGTRNATEYGLFMCNRIIPALKETGVGIISGLAYGIDTEAHRVCIQNNIPTFAVLGHGLKIIYPAVNNDLSRKIEDNGAVMTEYISTTNPDRENFPRRNRIIAGLSDAVLVIEAAEKGGALITAEIAIGYNRDVFAIPGRVNDHYSTGCNMLIKRQKAVPVHSAEDIIVNMNWDKALCPITTIQQSLFYDLTDVQKIITDLLEKEGRCDLDKMLLSTQLRFGRLSQELLDLELKGIVKCLPGNIYSLR